MIDQPPPSHAVVHTPIHACHHTLTGVVAPVAYGWVRQVFTCESSAVFRSEFGECRIRPGDPAVLGINTLCGSRLIDHSSATTSYLVPRSRKYPFCSKTFGEHIERTKDV
ncbi:hypothetical protein [Streptomyces sp. NPDC048295]|uniref:hypothetical protein n=1 Tax=Streptomyces sp. NPDC048295 TaxID=3154617 RepID=UPI00343A0676